MPQRARRIRSAEGPFFINRLHVVSAQRQIFNYAVESAWPLKRRADLSRVRTDLVHRRLLVVPLSLSNSLRVHLPASPQGDFAAAVASIHAYFADGFRYTLDLPP